MNPFLADMTVLTLASAIVTTVVVAAVRLFFRPGRDLEEP